MRKGLSIAEIPNEGYIILSSNNDPAAFLTKYLLTRVSEEGEEIWSKEIDEDNLINPGENIVFNQ